jgi:hypothetical protein
MNKVKRNHETTISFMNHNQISFHSFSVVVKPKTVFNFPVDEHHKINQFQSQPKECQISETIPFDKKKDFTNLVTNKSLHHTKVMIN